MTDILLAWITWFRRGKTVRKATVLGALATAELMAMSLWFSASAVVPQLSEEWNLSGGGQAGLTVSVQAGFVVGALLSAFLNLADRWPAERLFAVSALAGALANAAIPLLDSGPGLAVALRFATGVTLAGVYPPGMKLVASWTVKDRGLGIGILVGALTLGSGVPHLLNALPAFGTGGMPPWRSVLLASSGLAGLAAVLVALGVRPGPHLGKAAVFDWRLASRALHDRPVRLANFGYLGHMWELYAMWTWVPLFLLESYRAANLDLGAARLAGFGVLAAGAVGCVAAGLAADRLGRSSIAIASLAVSGCCALAAGLLFEHPAALTALCLLWGFAVVADSAQFSAAVSELSDSRYVGTALTVQTCLGFLLTLLTIRMIPPLVDLVGWRWAFSGLALGPALGAWAMALLRRTPEAVRMASGRR